MRDFTHTCVCVNGVFMNVCFAYELVLTVPSAGSRLSPPAFCELEIVEVIKPPFCVDTEHENMIDLFNGTAWIEIPITSVEIKKAQHVAVRLPSRWMLSRSQRGGNGSAPGTLCCLEVQYLYSLFIFISYYSVFLISLFVLCVTEKPELLSMR